MAVYKIFPTQDATLYSLFPQMNTGLDEIIEATLTTFMGTGRYLDDPISTDGTSWYWQNYSGSTLWPTTYASLPNRTGSYTGSGTSQATNAYAGGGVWWTGSNVSYFNSNTYPISASVTFGFYENKDLNFNITNAIRARYTGAISADGFIIKQETEFIYNKDIQPELKYFSRDTNTIYPPALQFSWRDYSFNTGSSTQTILNTLPATINLAQNPGVFFSQSVNRFRLNARPEFPIQLWTTSSVYLNNFYLPTSSYYAIKDLETNEFVVEFDNLFTQISADSESSYFDVYMNGLEPERYYAILIKSNIAGTTQVFDNQYYFKVING